MRTSKDISPAIESSVSPGKIEYTTKAWVRQLALFTRFTRRAMCNTPSPAFLLSLLCVMFVPARVEPLGVDKSEWELWGESLNTTPLMVSRRILRHKQPRRKIGPHLNLNRAQILYPHLKYLLHIRRKVILGQSPLMDGTKAKALLSLSLKAAMNLQIGRPYCNCAPNPRPKP